MKKVRIGVVGLGLISQLEHIPNLLKLSEQFDLIGGVDPSAKARTFFSERGVKTFETLDALFDCKPDAILVATPDSYHGEIILAALAQGVHVFSEKPMCYDAADATKIAAVRDQAGRVVQIGYMKRFDPSYQLLCGMLPRDGKGLRLINVEVQDPQAWPFNVHQGKFCVADDISQQLIADSRTRRDTQVKAAMGGSTLQGVTLRGFCDSYSSSLVHDINAVHGLLDVMGVKTAQVCGATFFAKGDGGQGTVRLTGGASDDAIWQMTLVGVPKLAQYRERITLNFDDSIYALEFPSPYLNHFPTRLTVERSDGHHWTLTEHRNGFGEAFQLELQGFWESVVEGKPVRNTVEAAECDMRLIAEMTKWGNKVGALPAT